MNSAGKIQNPFTAQNLNLHNRQLSSLDQFNSLKKHRKEKDLPKQSIKSNPIQLTMDRFISCNTHKPSNRHSSSSPQLNPRPPKSSKERKKPVAKNNNTLSKYYASDKKEPSASPPPSVKKAPAQLAPLPHSKAPTPSSPQRLPRHQRVSQQIFQQMLSHTQQEMPSIKRRFQVGQLNKQVDSSQGLMGQGQVIQSKLMERKSYYSLKSHKKVVGGQQMDLDNNKQHVVQDGLVDFDNSPSPHHILQVDDKNQESPQDQKSGKSSLIQDEIGEGQLDFSDPGIFYHRQNELNQSQMVIQIPLQEIVDEQALSQNNSNQPILQRQDCRILDPDIKSEVRSSDNAKYSNRMQQKSFQSQRSQSECQKNSQIPVNRGANSPQSSIPLIERSEFLIDENDIYYDEMPDDKSSFSNGIYKFHYGQCQDSSRGHNRNEISREESADASMRFGKKLQRQIQMQIANEKYLEAQTEQEFFDNHNGKKVIVLDDDDNEEFDFDREYVSPNHVNQQSQMSSYSKISDGPFQYKGQQSFKVKNSQLDLSQRSHLMTVQEQDHQPRDGTSHDLKLISPKSCSMFEPLDQSHFNHLSIEQQLQVLQRDLEAKTKKLNELKNENKRIQANIALQTSCSVINICSQDFAQGVQPPSRESTEKLLDLEMSQTEE